MSENNQTTIPDYMNAIIKYCAAYGQPARWFLLNILRELEQEAYERGRRERDMVIEHYIPKHATPKYEAFSIQYADNLQAIVNDISDTLKSHGFELSSPRKNSLIFTRPLAQPTEERKSE